MARLSTRDRGILDAIFDPEAALGRRAEVEIAATSLPYLPEAEFAVLQAEERHILKPLDTPSPSVSVIEKAIDSLTVLIQQNPHYAPAYVNRAQASRLLVDVDAMFTPEHSVTTSRILADLSTAIELSTPSPQVQVVSSQQAKLLAASHTHRGFLLLKAADMKRKGLMVESIGSSVGIMDGDQIEELASKDFFLGGKFGNAMAQQMSVKTNPYAKMCGAIVKEAMRKEILEMQDVQPRIEI